MNTAPFNGPNLNSAPYDEPALIQGSISDYLENRLVDHIFRGVPYNPPATLFVGLLNSIPNDAGFFTEVATGVGNGYSRIGVIPSLTSFCGTQGLGSVEPSIGGDGVTKNNVPLTFPTPDGSWGEVVAFGIFDAITGGNLLVYGLMRYPKRIDFGDPAPKFPIGALTITAK